MSGESITPLHEHHELGHHTLYLICDIHLIAIELDAVVTDVDVVLNLREIKDAGESERDSPH